MDWMDGVLEAKMKMINNHARWGMAGQLVSLVQGITYTISSTSSSRSPTAPKNAQRFSSYSLEASVHVGFGQPPKVMTLSRRILIFVFLSELSPWS